MPKVEKELHKAGDFLVDYEEKVFPDVKADPGEKALVTFHTVAFEGSIGIVNTLVLSISERTREIGMLRAIGTTQKQVRKIVRWEAVITAMIGGILGCLLGLGLSVLFISPIDGFKLSIPIVQILIFVVLSGLAGVAAAIWPAASRIGGNW